MKSVLWSMAIVLVVSGIASASTVAYYELDDWNTRAVLLDTVGSSTLTRIYSQSWDNFVGANPIPNPDPGPFAQGDPAANTRSLKSVRGYLPTPATTFNMTGSSSWTLEGWINSDGVNASRFIAATRGADTNWTGWEWSIQWSGRLDVRMSNAGGVSKYIKTADAFFLVPGEWTHVALVWDHDDGADGTASFYVNGVYANYNNVNAGNGDLGGGAKALSLGGRDNTGDGTQKPTGSWFNGHMDEMRFSDEALDPSQFLNVPEPATVGLLSLGVLVLRKRKRS